MDSIKDSQGSVDNDATPPDRSSSSSAPPALQLASESLFAWKVEYAKIFSDIRAHEDYFNFYEHYKEEKRGLPPPLDPTFLFEFDEDINRQRNAFVQPGSSFDSNDIQLSMQNMKINSTPITNNGNSGNSGGGSIGGVWNPVPRQPRPKNSIVFTESFEETNLLLNRMAEKFDMTYSSSPSAQTAVGAVNYIWKDEDQSITPSNSNSDQSINSGNTNPTYGFFNNELNDSNNSNNSNNSSNSGKVFENEVKEERTIVICRYYASGYCSRGDKCFYSHDLSLKHAVLSPLEDDHPLPENNLVNNSSNVTSNTSVTHNIPTKNDSKKAISTSGGVSGGVNKNTTTPSKNNSNSNNGGRGVSGNNSANVTPIKSTSPTPMNTSPESPTSPRAQEYTFETLIGRIYHVCKDQQGCRFLQKKLEENEPKATETIFNEVYDHISELMIDPFGNYLCQKILEHCNDHQRFLVVQKVASELVSISKNMHGTRAVQKMIECLSSPSQVELIKRALCNSVVELIQDLNGNHVIQRCLNRLSPDDNQFIYDAVTSGNNCVEVATHRHGCCVLQRCIDHASTKQKIQLIHEITKNALVLVQDAYGNYVVQYILDLPFPNLVDSLAKSFVGNIRILATQKFSSNVVEKCLQSCSPDVRYVLVREVLSEKHHFLQLLQDPFANYVIQTALTTSEPQQHHDLIEAIKPFMNQLRNTPYGKRIQSKLTTKDSHPEPVKHHPKHR